MKRVAMAAFALLASPAAGATPTSPAGRWLTEDKGGVIEIAPCGDALCGRIIGMDYKGAMPTDHWHRPQCGLGLLYALKPGDTSWNGSVLDPQTGKMYSAKVSIPEPGVLKLRGYVGIALFGQTVTWTRYPGGPIGPACHLPRG